MKKETLRKVGIGYHEVVAGRTTAGELLIAGRTIAGELRRLVDKLKPGG